MIHRWPVQLGAAAVLGLCAALAQAPYGYTLLLLPAMAGAVWLLVLAGSVRRAAGIGWAFGTGYFILSMIWILQPFQVDAATYGWMAPFALLLLAAGLALFWGAAFGLTRRVSPKGVLPLVLLWPLAEVLRAYVFTGFPWAMFPQALINAIAGQGLAWVGPHGMMLLLTTLAVGIAVAGWVPRLVLLAGGSALLLPTLAPQATPGPHVLRLVQPNAAQHLKWDPDMIPVFYARQLDLIAAAPAGPEPDLVVLPETAIPWALDLAGGALEEISAAAGGVPVLMGAQRRAGLRYFNAAAVIGSGGAVGAVYDKHHLVPFGEYFPLGDLAANFGLHGLAAREGRGYSAGPGARLLDLGALGKALPLICYEAVFAHDVNAAQGRPDFLVQLTNDAWFGRDSGPLQHLALARMRAIEQGLPLARSANTGITAMIDPYGRVTHALKMGQTGFIDAALPLPLAPTLYSRTGDVPLIVLLLLGLALSTLRAGRRNRH